MNELYKYLLKRVKNIGFALADIITVLFKEIPVVYWEWLKCRITGKKDKEQELSAIAKLLWKLFYLSLCLLICSIHRILKRVSFLITPAILFVCGLKVFQNPIFLVLAFYSVLYLAEECIYFYYMSREDFWENRSKYMEKIIEKISDSLFMPEEAVKKRTQKQVEMLEEKVKDEWK